MKFTRTYSRKVFGMWIKTFEIFKNVFKHGNIKRTLVVVVAEGKVAPRMEVEMEFFQ